MIGYPGETRFSFLKTIRWAEKLKQLGMKTFILSIAQPYPQTPLWQRCKQQGYLVKDDVENILFFSEYPEVNIITPEFSQKEIYSRFNYAMRKLNPVEYWGGKLLPRSWTKRVLTKEMKDVIISWKRQKQPGTNMPDCGSLAHAASAKGVT
jgi:radical SAM superfamily enzyme YgiQ (UPF0313 family)